MEKFQYFNFTKTEFINLCDECMLNEEYKKLFEMKIKEYSRPKMADELHISIDTLDDMLAKLKKKIKKVL